MPRTVIAAYKAKTGMSDALNACVAKHWHVLREQNLVTDRSPFVMRSADGTIVEVFEWLSPEAIGEAHCNAAVQALWDEFFAVCEFTPIAAVPESSKPFSEFEAHRGSNSESPR